MAPLLNDPLSAADARDSRRWLIGVAISLAFGLFGVLMALLAYAERRPASSPPAVKAPAAKVPAARGGEREPDKDAARRREHRK